MERLIMILLKVGTYVLLAFSSFVSGFSLVWEKLCAVWQFAKELNQPDVKVQPRDPGGRHGRYHSRD